MKPFFSVIIPVYNVSLYLKVCLDSLLEATKKILEGENVSIEFICVNDGSTDESMKILEEFTLKFNSHSSLINYQVYSQANKGLGATRNEGLSRAKGAWILFIDSDDFVSKDYFLELWHCIKMHEPCVVHFGHLNVYSQDIDKNLLGSVSRCFTLTKDAKEIFKILYSATVWNLCYRRDVIANIKFENITPGEDALFNSAILANVKSIAKIPTSLYCYLQRPNSLMHKKEISFNQLHSCMIAFSGRFHCAKEWEHYTKITKELYKLIRTTFLGQDGQMLRSMCKDKTKAWDEYCKLGYTIYSSKIGCIPCYIRLLGEFIFKFKIYSLWLLLMYFPMQIRIFLLKFGCVRKLKMIIRS